MILLLFAILSVFPGHFQTNNGRGIDISYSHVLLSHNAPPDEGFLEGGQKVTFSSPLAIEDLNPESILTRIDEYTFEYVFSWDEHDTLVVSFYDSQGDTAVVSAYPQRMIPFSLTNHNIPILSLTMNPQDLWDPETGIYVWGLGDNCFQHGEEWEREAHFEYYDEMDNLVVSEQVGIRISGQFSRGYDQKSLRFYFDHFGDENDTHYDFFNSEPADFQRLLIRTSRNLSKLVHSNIAENKFRELGNLGSRYRPLVTYLNGEYWGVYSLRERIDSEFIEDTHELADDGEFIIVKDGNQFEGDINEWLDFLASFENVEDYNSHEWFSWVRSQMDLQSFVDWKFLNIFCGSSEAGLAHNMAVVKTNQLPWTHIMWDEDTIFHQDNLNANHFRFFAAADEAEFEEFRPPHFYPVWNPNHQSYCTIFNALMHNSEFKHYFSTRVDSLLSDPVSIDGMIGTIDELIPDLYPEISMQHQRWTGYSENSFTIKVNQIRDWISERHPIVVEQKVAFMEYFRDPVELSFFSVSQDNNTNLISWRTDSEFGIQGFNILRSIGDDEHMVPWISYEDYQELESPGDSSLPRYYTFVVGLNGFG